MGKWNYRRIYGCTAPPHTHTHTHTQVTTINHFSDLICDLKLWCWRRPLKVPWTARRSNQSILKEIGPEYSLEGLMETESPILWPPDAKSRLIRKDPDAGKDRRQEEKGMTEDEMVGWHHRLNGHEFEQALGDGEGQGSLASCSPWVTKSRTQCSD